uniref:Uncharacterized protein n=1 Tax=Acrobeloides nanus TaxID=290746 RepID=A0A914EES8_9BILA
MAVGNGASDVFTSLASALSTNQPKAGLSIGELLELKAEELHALEQKASAMNSMLSIPNGNTRLSIPNGNNSVPNGNMRLSIPNGNHNLLGVSTVEQTIVNGWVEKPLHPDEISYYVDYEHKDHNQKKISLIRSKSDIVSDRNKIVKFSNKVGCVTTVPSRRDTQVTVNIPSDSALYGSLRIQLAANMMLPSMIAKGVDEEDYEEQRPIIEHGKFFPVVDEDDDEDGIQ